MKTLTFFSCSYNPIYNWFSKKRSYIFIFNSSTSKSSFVDGVAGIETAYTLDGIKIEPYLE